MKVVPSLLLLATVAVAHEHHDHHGHHHHPKDLKSPKPKPSVPIMIDEHDHSHHGHGLSYEEAIDAIGSEVMKDFPQYNIKPIYDSENQVKLVKSDGSLGDFLIQRGTAVTTVMKKMDPKDRFWHRFKYCDTVVTWHGGCPIKIHMVDADGARTTTLLGDALKDKNAEFAIHVPSDHFMTFEVVDEPQDSYSVLSMIYAAGWRADDQIRFPLENIGGSWYDATNDVMKNLAEDDEFGPPEEIQ